MSYLKSNESLGADVIPLREDFDDDDDTLARLFNLPAAEGSSPGEEFDERTPAEPIGLPDLVRTLCTAITNELNKQLIPAIGAAVVSSSRTTQRRLRRLTWLVAAHTVLTTMALAYLMLR